MLFGAHWEFALHMKCITDGVAVSVPSRLAGTVNAVHQLASRPLLCSALFPVDWLHSCWAYCFNKENDFPKPELSEAGEEAFREPDKLLSVGNHSGDQSVKCLSGFIYIETSSTAFHKLTQIWYNTEWYTSKFFHLQDSRCVFYVAWFTFWLVVRT